MDQSAIITKWKTKIAYFLWKKIKKKSFVHEWLSKENSKAGRRIAFPLDEKAGEGRIKLFLRYIYYWWKQEGELCGCKENEEERGRRWGELLKRQSFWLNLWTILCKSWEDLTNELFHVFPSKFGFFPKWPFVFGFLFSLNLTDLISHFDERNTELLHPFNFV